MPEKGDKEKILIAEASHSAMVLLESALEAEGYEVFCAQTGEKAMELAESGCPDLILLNIKMLDINDGVPPLEIFKKNKAAQAIPIIYMTALDGTFDSAGVFERGAVDYITQPIDTQELSAKVRSHLAIKRLRDEFEDADRQLKKQIAGSKQTQTALTKAHDQLEAKMVHRMKASLLAKEAAEAASRAKDAFLANMSHEIRTSINCIIGKTTLHFSVTDTGIGISEEQFDRIFQRFIRVDMQPQTGSNGTGLGLSIAKHLVELMGGDIWVESAPGSGSTFSFTVKLPAH